MNEEIPIQPKEQPLKSLAQRLDDEILRLRREYDAMDNQLSEACGTLRCVSDICVRNGIKPTESVHPMVLEMEEQLKFSKKDTKIIEWLSQCTAGEWEDINNKRLASFKQEFRNIVQSFIEKEKIDPKTEEEIKLDSFKKGLLYAGQILANNYGYEQCSSECNIIKDAHDRLKYLPIIQPDRCCDNGNFGEEHICCKQPGK
jgi:hypothetical protein